jgi:hypothetical protein
MPNPTVPTRGQKRWSARLRTAGALLLLAGTVAVADRLLPHAPDPVLGAERSPVILAVAAALLAVGAVLFVIGQRWR